MTTSERKAPASKVPAAMRSGIRGNNVKDLQVLLRDAGLYDRKIDGYYGNYTRNSVYKLQTQLAAEGHLVRPTGHFTQDTVTALGGTKTADTKEVASEKSESSPSSQATPRTDESGAGSQPTTTSQPSSEKATKSTSSSGTTSGRTRSKASKSSGTGRRTSGGSAAKRT